LVVGDIAKMNENTSPRPHFWWLMLLFCLGESPTFFSNINLSF